MWHVRTKRGGETTLRKVCESFRGGLQRVVQQAIVVEYHFGVNGGYMYYMTCISLTFAL